MHGVDSPGFCGSPLNSRSDTPSNDSIGLNLIESSILKGNKYQSKYSLRCTYTRNKFKHTHLQTYVLNTHDTVLIQ